MFSKDAQQYLYRVAGVHFDAPQHGRVTNIPNSAMPRIVREVMQTHPPSDTVRLEMVAFLFSRWVGG